MAYSADGMLPGQQRLLSALLASRTDDDEDDNSPSSLAVTPRTASEPAFVPPNLLAQALAGGGVSMPPSARPVPSFQPMAPSVAAPAAEHVPSTAPAGTHYAQGPGAPLLVRDDQDAATVGGSLGAVARAVGGAPPQASQPEGRSVAQTAAQQAPSTSGQAGDPYTQWVMQHHAEAVAGYNQAVAAARTAAGSNNPDLAASYLKAADGYRAEAQKASELYGASLKGPETVQPGQYVRKPGSSDYYQPVPGETTRIIPPDEAKAKGLTDGVYEQDAKGAITRVTGTEEAKDTTEVQNYKFDQQNRKDQGLPPISFSDWNTQKTMYGKGERPLVDATGKEIDQSVSGDELLKSLPPAVANHAKAIAEIREKWPSGTEQARQPQLQQALAAAQQLDPSLNQTSYQTRQQMKNSAESGSGRINVANLANNTALFHSSTLADAIVGLNNSNNTVLNAAINTGAGATGGIIPGAVGKADEVKQFNVARDAVANELERSFHGVGTTAEQAVKRQIDDLSVNDAPQTQLGALKAAQDLLRGKIEANEADYKDTMGDKNIAAWERDHGRPFGFITPAAQAAGDRVAAMYESVKTGKGFHGFEPSAPATQAAHVPGQRPPPAQMPRNVAPDVTGAPPRKGVYVPGKGIQWQ